jgi:hypothetical protein
MPSSTFDRTYVPTIRRGSDKTAESRATAAAESRADAGRAANDAGADAREPFDERVTRAKIPPPLPTVRPGQPAALPVDPPTWRAGLGGDLVELATDAAVRAWEMAMGLSDDAGLSLTAEADLARRVARALGTPSFGPIDARSGIGAAI